MHRFLTIAIILFLLLSSFIPFTSGYENTSNNIIQEAIDNAENDLPKKTITNKNDNLAPNPSFEEGDTLPTGWTYYNFDGTGIFLWDSNFAHSGEKSVGVLNTTSPDSGGYAWLSDFIPVDVVNNIYEFSGWYKFIGKIPEDVEADFWIYFYNKEFKFYGASGTKSNFSLEWNYVYRDTNYEWFGDPYGPRYVKLKLFQVQRMNTTDPLLEVRFDDIYFGVLTKRPTNPVCNYDKIKDEIIVSSTDPDGDQIRYGVSWNNDHAINKWTDFYNSGVEVKIDCRGKIGIVGVIAEDINGGNSGWISVKSKDKLIDYQILNWLFSGFSIHFSFFEKILNQII